MFALTVRSAAAQWRAAAIPCVAAAFLPLPLLLIVDPATNADVSCVYLGLACAWLASEIVRAGGAPATRPQWCATMLTIAFAALGNATLFAVLGATVGVQSQIPFPLLAFLSALPAITLVPWLVLRVRQPLIAI